MRPELRRGDVWLAQLDKIRPVVILTRDPVASMLNAVIVVPVTSRGRGLATQVSLGRADGFRRASFASTDNTTSLDTQRLVRPVGRVRPATLEAICDALATAVDCG